MRQVPGQAYWGGGWPVMCVSGGGWKLTGVQNCIPLEWCYKMSITPNWEGGNTCAQTLAQIGREIVGCHVQLRGSYGNRHQSSLRRAQCNGDHSE
jgi:hypothetical protein